jgi:hypothetical protein
MQGIKWTYAAILVGASGKYLKDPLDELGEDGYYQRARRFESL